MLLKHISQKRTILPLSYFTESVLLVSLPCPSASLPHNYGLCCYLSEALNNETLQAEPRRSHQAQKKKRKHYQINFLFCLKNKYVWPGNIAEMTSRGRAELLALLQDPKTKWEENLMKTNDPVRCLWKEVNHRHV